MRDETPRLLKIGDALSQLLNVACLPRHRETTANESISGRAHRERWRVEQWIDAAFRLIGQEAHCRRAYMKDLERARAFEAQHAERSDKG